MKKRCLALMLLIPLLVILPIFFGLDGILYAGPIADFSSAVIVAFFIIPEMKKLSAAARAEQERKTAQPAQS